MFPLWSLHYYKNINNTISCVEKKKKKNVTRRRLKKKKGGKKKILTAIKKQHTHKEENKYMNTPYTS